MMQEARFLRPGKDLVDFILAEGFRYCPGVPNTKKYYYVNNKGNQIKLDYKQSRVTFLNRYGYVVDSSAGFTEREITTFAKGDNN